MYLGTIGPWQVALIIAVFLPIIAIVDILRSGLDSEKKIIWVLVVLFFPFLGAIIYFIAGRK